MHCVCVSVCECCWGGGCPPSTALTSDLHLFQTEIKVKTSDARAQETRRTSGAGWLYSKSNVCNERGIIPTEQALHAQQGVGLNRTLIMDLKNKGISLSAESVECHLQRSSKVMQLPVCVCFFFSRCHLDGYVGRMTAKITRRSLRFQVTSRQTGEITSVTFVSASSASRPENMMGLSGGGRLS